MTKPKVIPNPFSTKMKSPDMSIDINGGQKVQPASFRDMMRYAERFDWILASIGILLSCVHGCLPACNMIIFRGITQTLIHAQSDYNAGHLDLSSFTSSMILYISLYLTHGIVTFIIGYISISCFFTLSERQTHRIKKEFLRTVLNQDQPWFEKNNVGKLTEKMTSLQAIIQASVSLFAGLGISFWMSWQMALILLAVNPFVMGNLTASAKTTKTALQRAMTAYGDAANVSEEVLYGVRTTQACNAQASEIGRYSKYLQIGCSNGIRRAMFTALFSGLHLLMLFGSMGLAFWYGTKLVLETGLEPGSVYACFWACLGGAMRLGNAIPQISVILAARLSAAEIFAIIDRKPSLDCNDPKRLKPEKVEGKIEFKNVNSRYPSRPDVQILRDVSFTIEKGSTIGIVGHSGSGKSTLLSLLLRYYDFESGSITIDGLSIKDLNVEWLRNTIGIVSQESVVFAGTVADNLRMGRVDVTMAEMADAARQANAEEFISKLSNGYNTILGEGGVRLSGGQRQRLSIARVLIRNPSILLLDEATSALDSESERLVQKAIESASSGRTTLIIAHRLATVKNVNRLLVFDGDRIVETGSHDELLANNGVYRKLVEAQEIEQIGKEETEGLGSLAMKTIFDDDLSDDSNQPVNHLRRRSSSSRRSSIRKKGYKSFENQSEKAEETDVETTPSASLAQIFRAARPEHPLIFFGLFATVIRGVSWPVFSIIYGRLFNSLTEALNHRETADFNTQNMINGIAFGVLGAVACICTFFSGYLFGMTGEKLTMRLRIRNILSQDGAFFDSPKNSTGKLAARLSSDAPNVQAAIDQRLADVLQGMVSLIAGLSIGFYFDWHMAPIAMCTAFLIVGTQIFLTNYMKRRGFKDAEIAEEASRVAAESIEHVKTIQALTRQSLQYNRYCEVSERPHKRAIKRGLLQAVSFGLTSAYFSIHFAFAYLFGLLFIRGGYITPFIVFQVIEAVTMASFTLMSAATYFPEYLRARVAAGLMFQMMETKPKINSNSTAGLQPTINGNVKLKDVYFAYPNAPQHPVLRGVSVEALEGKTVGIVGPSGSGKSTIVQLLERYYDALSGQIIVDGVDMREINIQHVRDRMALVGQDPIIFNISIADNISYGLENVSMERVIAAARQANIADFIESLPNGYETIAGSRGSQLSGGQRQRLSIARAVIRNPRILLLDEATSALDTQSERVVQEALDKAQKGRTVVVIAHRLSTIQHANLIVVVNDGKISETGTHQELLALGGVYSNLSLESCESINKEISSYPIVKPKRIDMSNQNEWVSSLSSYWSRTRRLDSSIDHTHAHNKPLNVVAFEMLFLSPFA
ncbi:Multidrug resistance protein pgp-3 [Aphelenchoides besseyi]|nr:Multidrug resistance protein pgp-3 [Aphelenchoides besseyi]